MTSLVFALSSDYARATGGFTYDMRLVAELERFGWRVTHLTLPAGFPRPSEAARRETAALFGALADNSVVMSDQLCLSVLPELALRHAKRLKFVVIVHHPLALEGYAGSAIDERLKQDEATALGAAALVIVTSRTTARTLVAEYGVAEPDIHVAVPGTDAQAISTGGDGRPNLLAVGAVVPRKGQDVLAHALAEVADLNWGATIVGNLERAPAHVAALRQLIATSGLAGRIALVGELDADALEAHWRRADVFVSASRHEGYGMALSEALARGLPVVSTRAGAVTDWLPEAAAATVPVDDAAAFAAALRRVIGDAGRRDHMREAALAYRARLPRWRDTAVAVAGRLSALIKG